jgi:hypothetical protein
MNKFLFCFGYCNPRQWTDNEAHGWDDESSSAFLVAADSEAAALARGIELAESALTQLFTSEGWEDPPSWTEANFAHWIEPTPSERFTDEQLSKVPVVDSIGEATDFKLLLGLAP